jgi:hypothetical protein
LLEQNAAGQHELDGGAGLGKPARTGGRISGQACRSASQDFGGHPVLALPSGEDLNRQAGDGRLVRRLRPVDQIVRLVE